MKSLIAIIFFTFSLCSFAKSSLEIKNAYVRFPPPGSTTSAMFFDVINNDNIDHKILKVSGPALSDYFELHEMNMSEGKMTMRKVDAILLKKKSTTSLKPGGLHIMIFNLKKPLKDNETVELTIEMDNKEKISTKAVVKIP